MNLISISHYHHQKETQPAGKEIPEGTEYIELVTHGRGWITESDQWVEVTPGTLLWHKPGDRAIQLSDPQDPYSCLVIRFHSHTPSRYPAPRISTWHDLDAIHNLTRKSIQLFTNERFDPQVLLRYLCERLYFQTQLSQWEQGSTNLPLPLQKALEFMDAHALEDLPLEQVARASGWSVSHLHSMFRQRLQQSPHQYRLAQRIQQAKIRLVSTNQPIKQIAQECRFSSVAALTTTFRQHTGTTPATYRKEHLR